MSDKPNELTTIPPVPPPTESKPKGQDKAKNDTSETVKLVHTTPFSVRGSFTLTRYKPDNNGVIVVDVRDAETLRQKWGWRDAT